MKRTLKLRFNQVVLNGIFYHVRSLGEWHKISDTRACNTTGEAVMFSPGEVVDAWDL